MNTSDYERMIEEMSSLSRTIFDLSDRHKSHIERGTALLKSNIAKNIYSFYMVDYDLSRGRILTQAIPIFIKDGSAVETWLTAFLLRKKLNLGSFAELFFSKMTKFPNIEFKLGDSANVDIQDYKIVITINKNEINKIKFSSLFNSNEITDLIKQKNDIKYVDYEAIDKVAEGKYALEIKSAVSLDESFNDIFRSFAEITDTQFRTNLNNLIKIALVLFVGNSKVSSFIIIPATTWEEGGRKESSGGFIILFTNDNRISLLQEHILTTIANSWFRQNTTTDLVGMLKSLQKIFQRMDHDISRHIVERIRSAETKEKRVFFADYLERRVKLMRKISVESLGKADLRDISLKKLIEDINTEFEFNNPKIKPEIEISDGNGNIKIYSAALELMFENLLINTHKFNTIERYNNKEDYKEEIICKINIKREDNKIHITYVESNGIGFKKQIEDLSDDRKTIFIPLQEKISKWKDGILSPYDLSKDDRGMGICLINTGANLLSGDYLIHQGKGLPIDRLEGIHVIKIP